MSSHRVGHDLEVGTSRSRCESEVRTNKRGYISLPHCGMQCGHFSSLLRTLLNLIEGLAVWQSGTLGQRRSGLCARYRMGENKNNRTLTYLGTTFSPSCHPPFMLMNIFLLLTYIEAELFQASNLNLHCLPWVASVSKSTAVSFIPLGSHNRFTTAGPAHLEMV